MNNNTKIDISTEWFEKFVTALFNLYEKYGVLAEFRVANHYSFPYSFPSFIITLAKGNYRIRRRIQFDDIFALNDKNKALEVCLEDMLFELFKLFKEENK